MEAGNPLPLNPSYTLVRFNVIENPRPDVQAVRAFSLSIQYDCIRNRFHHNLILNPTMGIRWIAPKQDNYFTHNTLLDAAEEGIFFSGIDEPLGEYHNSQLFNTPRSPERNVFQNNVIVQRNGRDFEHLLQLKQGYERNNEVSTNVFRANHWSSGDASVGDGVTVGDPRLGPGYVPANDSALVDSGVPLARTTSAGEGYQTGYGGFISPGPWAHGRPFGRFKTWPDAGADFRLGHGIYTRLEALSHIYLGRLAKGLTTYKAEWTMGIHYGTALLSVDRLHEGEFFRAHTAVARIVGDNFDAVITADRIEPTKVVVLRGEVVLTHRHVTNGKPIVVKAGQSATIKLDVPPVPTANVSPSELTILKAKLKGLRRK